MFLAKKRSQFVKPELENGSVFNTFEIVKKNEYLKVSRELFDYCQTLEYEAIKVLQTIMCIGRDRNNCNFMDNIRIYEKARQHKDLIGWRTKELDIYQIVEKEQLYQYLLEGFQILELDYLFQMV